MNVNIQQYVHQCGGFRDLRTREGFLAAIRDSGQYIIDNAESLLGGYPGALPTQMHITAEIRFGCVPKVTVTREHVVPPCDEKEG